MPPEHATPAAELNTTNACITPPDYTPSPFQQPLHFYTVIMTIKSCLHPAITFKYITFKPYFRTSHILALSKQNQSKIKLTANFFKVILKYFLLPKTLSSLMFLIQNHSPAGKVHTRICRSKKKETHVVG